MNTESVVSFALLFPLFMAAVVLHELSHGVVALWCGDDTASRAGRLTLNPLKHMDWTGMVFLPLLLVALHAPFVFGWAKPVPISPWKFRSPRRDMILVGAAGPASNFLLAIVIAAALRGFNPVLPPAASDLLRTWAVISLALGTFNLLPVPPLDGSRVLAGLLPERWSAVLVFLERWGILLVIGLLWLGVTDRLIWPVVKMMADGLRL